MAWMVYSLHPCIYSAGYHRTLLHGKWNFPMVYSIIQGCWDGLNGVHVYFLHLCICSAKGSIARLQPWNLRVVWLLLCISDDVGMLYSKTTVIALSTALWVSTVVRRRGTRWWGNLWRWISMIFVCFMYQHHIGIGLTCVGWPPTRVSCHIQSLNS